MADFVDIESGALNMCPVALARKLDRAARKIGLKQPDRFNAFLVQRNALADQGDAYLADLPLARPGRLPARRVLRLQSPRHASG